MRSYFLAAMCLVCMFTETCISAGQPKQNKNQSYGTTITMSCPQISLYSVTWCQNCKEAKKYFSKNNIPFIDHDVEMDVKTLDQLMEKYNSKAVPMIVIGAGKNEVVVKGFKPEQFKESLNKFRTENCPEW